MSRPIHLIVRLSDDGSVYATSPQAPGLVYGRPSLEALRFDLEDVLSFHFGRPGPFEVIEHQERHYDIAGHELVTRVAMDEHFEQRQAVYERIGQVLAVPGQAESLVSAVTNLVGETVYVCAVPSDTLGRRRRNASGLAPNLLFTRHSAVRNHSGESGPDTFGNCR
jgi:hypothetical protein